MHTHRIQVLDGADDDAVILAVPHHLHLVFFPADYRFFDQDFVRGAGIDTALHDGNELFLVVGNAAAGAAQGKRGPDNRRITHHRLHLQRFFHRVRQRRARAVEPDLGHRLLELFAILGLVDGFLRRTDHLDAVFFQHAVLGKIQRTIQCRLAPHRRQQRIRLFDGNDFFDHLPSNRLDVGRIRHVRIGHDGRWIRIHQHHAIALLAQRLACLRARVIKLARLTDDDRTCADDQNGLDVGSFGHG